MKIASDDTLIAEAVNFSSTKAKATSKHSLTPVVLSAETEGVLFKQIHENASYSLDNHNSLRALIQLADLHFSQKNYKKAYNYYISALKRTSQSAPLLRRVIKTLVQWKKSEDAIKFFDRLVDTYRVKKDIVTYGTFLIQLAADYEDLSLIEKKFKHLLELDIKNADTINTYGLLLLQMERYSEAHAYFESALRLDPKHIHAINNIGVYYQIINDFDSAAGYFNKANKLSIDYVYSFQNLASNYLNINNPDKAIAVLEGARERGLELTKTWKANLSELYIDHSQEYYKAREILLDLLDDDPIDPKLHNNIGVTYNRENERKLALEYYENATQLLRNQLHTFNRWDQAAPLIFQNLLRVYSQIGSNSRKIKLAKQMSKWFPELATPFAILGRVSLQDNDSEEARRLLQIAHKNDPTNPEVAVNLSYIYSVFDYDFESSIDVLKPYLEGALLNLDNFTAQLLVNNYSYALIQVGNLKEATHLIPKLPRLPYISSTKALLSLKKGNLQLAKKQYADSISQFDDKNDERVKMVHVMYSHLEIAKYFIDQKDFQAAQVEIDAGLTVVVPKEVKLHLLQLKQTLSLLKK